MRKYKPQLADARSWYDILLHYNELVDINQAFKPLLSLVTFIEGNEIRNRIYAYTSMHKLIVGIYNRIEWNSEALHIEFNIETREWLFLYFSKPTEPKVFEKKYKESEGIEKFKQIIKYLKW